MELLPIDAVIATVDDRDPVWREAASRFGVPLDPKRFRDWGTLRHWFRAVAGNMPWLRRVHLVVSNPEQVPAWLDTARVDVVLHRDIIPARYLPTFNSTTIEMHIPRIAGLPERFIYFNDDMFPVRPCSPDDFFDAATGLPCYELVWRGSARRLFRLQCLNSCRLAASVFGAPAPSIRRYFYIVHGATPLLKSVCDEVWEKAAEGICSSLSRFREPFNYTQYLWPDAAIFSGRYVERKSSLRYFRMDDPEAIARELASGSAKVVCLNDSNGVDHVAVPPSYSPPPDCPDVRFAYCRDAVLSALGNRFPSSCAFERA